MSQNYPIYRVVHGNFTVSSNVTVEIYIVQQAGPPTLNGVFTWINAPKDLNNLAIGLQPSNPGNVYVVGSGSGDYSTTQAAETAANLWCDSLASARDAAIAARIYAQGDITQLAAFAPANPIIVHGPE